MKHTLLLGLILITLTSCSRTESLKTEKIKLIEDRSSLSGVLIPYKKYQLRNGLTVLLHLDQSDPLVHVKMTYHVGSAREETGRSGFAHLFEHMMFQGSQHVGDNEHFKIVTQAGGSMNGATNRDMTYYYQTVPSNHLEKVLWLEADRMGFLLPALTSKKFENQRAVVKNERSQRVDNRPYGQVGEQLGASLYPQGHPYSWPVIGWPEDLEAAQIDDVKQFFTRWYAPNNATLVIGGDFKENEVLEWVVKYFSSIPSGPEAHAEKKTKVTLDRDRYITLEDRIHTPSLVVRMPTVHAHHKDEAALDILSEILGGSKTSILYQNLVKSGVAVDTGSSHFCYELACEFGLFAVLNPEKTITLKDLEQKIKASINEFEERGVNDDDLQKVKAQIEVSLIHQITNVAGKVSLLSNFEVLYNNPDLIQDELERYSQVTKEDVLSVFRRYIKGKSMVLLSVVPEGQTKLSAGNTFKVSKSQHSVPNKPVALPKRVVIDSFDRSKEPVEKAVPLVKVPPLWTHTFKNGMSLIGTASAEAPITEIIIKVSGGSDLETLDDAGIASLTAAMMNEATKHHSSEALAEKLDLMGSDIHFGSSTHESFIRISCLTRNLEPTLDLLQEMLFEPALLKADFERIQSQILATLPQRGKDIHLLSNDRFEQLLFGNKHRYSLPKVGTLESIRRFSLKDIRRFYKKQYRGGGAQLISYSSLSKNELLKKLAPLEQWKGKAVPPHVYKRESSKTGEIYLLDMPDAQQSVLRLGRLAMPYDVDGAYFKANLMNYPLGGAFNSRINLNLREDKGYTYGARSSYQGDRDFGTFLVKTDVQAQFSADALKQIFHELNQYQQKGMTQKELEFMRLSLLQQEALSCEKISQKLRFLGDIQRFSLSKDFPAQQDHVLSSIQLSELNSIAKTELSLDKFLILVVGPKEKIKPELIKIGYTVEEIK